MIIAVFQQVTGMSLLGDFLGFTAGVNQEMILPLLVGKLVAGSGALLLTHLLAPALLARMKG